MRQNILIVEDDKSMSKLLRRVLKKKYNTELCSDGFSAMKILSDGYFPNLIITDISMPNIDGMSFIKNLKLSMILKDIPVIVLTGSLSKYDKQECLSLDIVSYFEKPFKLENLLEIIDRVLASE